MNLADKRFPVSAGDHNHDEGSEAFSFKSVSSVASVYFLLLLAVHTSIGGAAEWRVADQPNLKQELENATVLKTESLGEPARGVNVWERWFVPNHDGKSWDLLQI